MWALREPLITLLSFSPLPPPGHLEHVRQEAQSPLKCGTGQERVAFGEQCMGPGSCVLLRDYRVARSRGAAQASPDQSWGQTPGMWGWQNNSPQRCSYVPVLGTCRHVLYMEEGTLQMGLRTFEMARRCWILEVGLMSSLEMKVVPFISETGRWGEGVRVRKRN